MAVGSQAWRFATSSTPSICRVDQTDRKNPPVWDFPTWYFPAWDFPGCFFIIAMLVALPRAILPLVPRGLHTNLLG